jgi:hypothetical protein
VQEKIGEERTNDSALRRTPITLFQGTIWLLDGRLEPTLDMQQHPGALRVMPNRSHQETVIDPIKEASHVEIKNPVATPAPPTRYAHGINCRSLRPITVGVFVKVRLQDWLQDHLHDRLGYPIGNRGNAKLANPFGPLRNLDPADRCREVTS